MVLVSSTSTSISSGSSPLWASMEASRVGHVALEAGAVGVVVALAPPERTHVLVERIVGLLHHALVESLSLSNLSLS